MTFQALARSHIAEIQGLRRGGSLVAMDEQQMENTNWQLQQYFNTTFLLHL
jgi:hypothetical protein